MSKKHITTAIGSISVLLFSSLFLFACAKKPEEQPMTYQEVESQKEETETTMNIPENVTVVNNDLTDTVPVEAETETEEETATAEEYEIEEFNNGVFSFLYPSTWTLSQRYPIDMNPNHPDYAPLDNEIDVQKSLHSIEDEILKPKISIIYYDTPVVNDTKRYYEDTKTEKNFYIPGYYTLEAFEGSPATQKQNRVQVISFFSDIDSFTVKIPIETNGAKTGLSWNMPEVQMILNSLTGIHSTEEDTSAVVPEENDIAAEEETLTELEEPNAEPET